MPRSFHYRARYDLGRRAEADRDPVSDAGEKRMGGCRVTRHSWGNVERSPDTETRRFRHVGPLGPSTGCNRSLYNQQTGDHQAKHDHHNSVKQFHVHTLANAAAKPIEEQSPSGSISLLLMAWGRLLETILSGRFAALASSAHGIAEVVSEQWVTPGTASAEKVAFGPCRTTWQPPRFLLICWIIPWATPTTTRIRP